MPTTPISELSEKQVKKVIDTSGSHLHIGIFDVNLLQKFLAVVSEKSQGENVAFLVTYRKDDRVTGGAIFAEIQTEPKQYIGITGKCEAN